MKNALSYEDFLQEQLKKPEVKKEYDALEFEFAAIRRKLEKATQ